jgi:amidohydrolase
MDGREEDKPPITRTFALIVPFSSIRVVGELSGKFILLPSVLVCGLRGSIPNSLSGIVESWEFENKSGWEPAYSGGIMEEKDISLRIREAVEKHAPAAKALSDDLGDHPEISAREFESSKKIVAVLKKAGYRIEFPYCGMETAFRAALDRGSGPSVALMVEYDALPVVGHGCGHNLHGALSVLSALALMDLGDLVTGKLYIIGTPDEEVNGGKIAMAEKGVFDGLSLAAMIHSTSRGLCQADMDALSLRSYTMEFFGNSAHAVASPWAGHSALAAARKFLDLIDARRECFTPDIHVNAVITDGGQAVNVIPEHAGVRIEFRTASMAALASVDDMIVKCAKGAALALDCDVKWTRNYDDFADMVRIKTLEDEVESLFTSRGAKMEAISPPIGSTDVGNVSYRCPAVQPLVAISAEDLALHTREFAAATKAPAAFEAMKTGAEILAVLALKVFRDGEFRDKIQKDFKESLEKKAKI